MVLEKTWGNCTDTEDSDSSTESEDESSKEVKIDKLEGKKDTNDNEGKKVGETEDSDDEGDSEKESERGDSEQEDGSEKVDKTESSDEKDKEEEEEDSEIKDTEKRSKVNDSELEDEEESNRESKGEKDSSPEEVTDSKITETSDKEEDSENTEDTLDSENNRSGDLKNGKTNEQSISSSPSSDEVVVTFKLPSKKKVSPKSSDSDNEFTVKTEKIVLKKDKALNNCEKLEDKMKESSKNLIEEIRRKQGGKIEDKIKRLVSKSSAKDSDAIRSEKRITGLSKNAELKLKLEENLKKIDERIDKRSDFNGKSKVVNLMCRDIIAAKKHQIDRNLERSKLDETLSKPVKKIQKINLDLKSKLEQGLDFNKTRRTCTKSVVESQTTTEIKNDSEDVDSGEDIDNEKKAWQTKKNNVGVKSSMLLDLENALKSKKATPHLSSKRKSVNGRKLRPKSVVDSAEGMSADDIPDLLPSLPTSAEESLDSVTELPVSTTLQHLVKSRPRRTKTRAPTRATPPALQTQEDDGLGAFFSASNTPVLSPLSDDNRS